MGNHIYTLVAAVAQLLKQVVHCIFSPYPLHAIFSPTLHIFSPYTAPPHAACEHNSESHAKQRHTFTDRSLIEARYFLFCSITSVFVPMSSTILVLALPTCLTRLSSALLAVVVVVVVVVESSSSSSSSSSISWCWCCQPVSQDYHQSYQ